MTKEEQNIKIKEYLLEFLILKTLCKKFQVFLYMEKFNLEEKRNGFKFWY